MSPQEAQVRIENVQNGRLDRYTNFPAYMKGKIAQDNWHDPMFAYGMEYGYLLAMLDIQEMYDSTAPSGDNDD